MKISVLSSQYIIQVFRLINMLLSCIYTFVYFRSIVFLREVIISGQHGKKGTAILCASSAEDDLFPCIFVLLPCYYSFITFLEEGWGMDKRRGLIEQTDPLVCEPSGLVSRTQGGPRTP